MNRKLLEAVKVLSDLMEWIEDADNDGYHKAQQFLEDFNKNTSTPDERRGEREVKRFAEAMIEKLNEPEKNQKGDWRQYNAWYHFDRLEQEIAELKIELIGSNTSKEAILKECADVANFAMMIADVMGALEREGGGVNK